MKNSIFGLIILIAFSSSTFGISPFFKLAKKKASITDVAKEIRVALETADYDILGMYNISNDANKMVIVFTNGAIKTLSLSYSDRGALAIAQKVSLIYTNGKTTVSLLNPLYMFNAYFQKGFDTKAIELRAEYDAIRDVFKQMGFSFEPFGGDVRTDDLREYQYMIGMPEFTDPVKLETYDSFNEGVKTIRENLKAKKGNTVKVYELVFTDKKVAVFGVGLLDAEEGEANFLPIIGENQLAAMPYEIILEDTKATMLHGRYRFALYWPELTMSTFTKIMSTPGNVEEFLEDIAD